MTGCIYKCDDGRCDKPGKYMAFCIGEACTSQTPSNYDRIVSMTTEELAEWVTTVGRTFGEEYDGYMSAIDWLKAPADKEAE